MFAFSPDPAQNTGELGSTPSRSRPANSKILTMFSAHQILASVLRTGEMLAELPGDLGHADLHFLPGLTGHIGGAVTATTTQPAKPVRWLVADWTVELSAQHRVLVP